MTSRRRGRQFAVQILYQKEFSEYALERVLELFWQSAKADAGTRNFAEDLAMGVLDNRQELDLEISAYLKNWSLDRIAAMDHFVLQIGFYELLHQQDVPWKVVIDEAVNLAKMFSSEKSATFINGVLHAWASRNRSEENPSEAQAADADSQAAGAGH